MARTRAPGSRRTSQNRHAQNMQPRVPRSSINRSSRHSTTLEKAGLVYPIGLHEVLPGDTMRITVGGLVRYATLINPILDDVQVDIHVFFVPDRLVWDNAFKFYGEQDDLDNPVTYLKPITTSTAATHGEGTIFDYYGIPIAAGGVGIDGIEHSCLPLRGYEKIHEDWYRHQELTPKYGIPTDDGPDPANRAKILQRNRRYDYFSAALTSPQRGTGPSLPIGGTAPLLGFPHISGTANPYFQTVNSGDRINLEARDNSPGDEANIASSTTLNQSPSEQLLSWGQNPGDTGLNIDLTQGNLGSPAPFADLGAASGFTVEQLRDTIALQHFLEAEARGGSRYAELVDVFFGVNFPDLLYRPAFLGGGTIPIAMHQVPQTSGTVTGSDASAQANLAAYAQGVGITRPIVFSAVEHGFVHILASARRGSVTYQHGVEPLWSRRSRFEHYWPQFANLSEEGIPSRQIFADGSAGDDDVWGYIPRWDSYRYGFNRLSGKMRSNASGTLHSWNLADTYSTRPSLNEEWMKENPDIDRTVAIQDEPHFLAEFAFGIQHTRCMPITSVPGLRRF